MEGPLHPAKGSSSTAEWKEAEGRHWGMHWCGRSPPALPPPGRCLRKRTGKQRSSWRQLPNNTSNCSEVPEVCREHPHNGNRERLDSDLTWGSCPWGAGTEILRYANPPTYLHTTLFPPLTLPFFLSYPSIHPPLSSFFSFLPYTKSSLSFPLSSLTCFSTSLSPNTLTSPYLCSFCFIFLPSSPYLVHQLHPFPLLPTSILILPSSFSFLSLLSFLSNFHLPLPLLQSPLVLRMMAEMEKLDTQFLLETHITGEEEVSKEEVGSPGKEEGGEVRSMKTKVGFLSLSSWIPLKGQAGKHGAAKQEHIPWKPYWALFLERTFLQGAWLVHRYRSGDTKAVARKEDADWR